LQEAWFVDGGWKMSHRRLSRLGVVAVWTGCETAGIGAESTAGACPAHAALAATTAREQIKKVRTRVALLIRVSFPESAV